MTIFTDFKRFNETHFWSESRQVWLNQYDLHMTSEHFNPEFIFFDEARNHHFENIYPELGSWLCPWISVSWKFYFKMWWFCHTVISDAEGNLHNCKGKHTSCICRPNDVIKYVYVLSCVCSLILIATIILREYFFRIITDVMKIQDSTK